MRASFQTNTPWSGVTGHQFEEEFLGTCRVSWNGSYMQYSQAMNLVRSSQPADALHPLGRKLQQEVAQQLNAAPEDVKFFTALGTALDKFHGVDCFVEFQGTVVTIDLTMSSKRMYKANVMITQEDVDSGLWLAAERIVYAMRSASRPSVRA